MKKLLHRYFNIPDHFYKMDNKYLIVATFFGIGYVKKAPGTVASFISLLIYILLFSLSQSLFMVATILVIIIGLYTCEKIYTEDNMDPSYVVIDEVAGQGIALLLVGESIILAIIAFLIFRFLDIKKPWIIKSSEKSFKGGSAIMMDDIIAGFITLIIVTIISLFIR